MPVGASLGVVLASGFDDPEQLLRNADLALHQAQVQGRGRYALYEPAMHAEVLARLELERELRKAVDDPRGSGLAVHYQPVVDLRTGRIVAAEALLRWTSPTRGPVSPLDLIPVAEDTGLIVPLGRLVLDRACAALAGWRGAGHDVRVAVNVSVRQLESSTFVESVAAILDRHGLPPATVTLEITESVLLGDGERALRALGMLRDLGVGLAVDDFGTGWSSLSYLRRLPVDTVKIDRSFVAGLATEQDLQALTRAIVTLGHDLGKHLVGEGVETPEQAAHLLAMGCRLAQGWLFAPAVPTPGAGGAARSGPVPGAGGAVRPGAAPSHFLGRPFHLFDTSRCPGRGSRHAQDPSRSS